MTRKKVKLAYIINDSARKATFKKRKKGLIKKVSELSILCGIDACAIIYSPYESQPELWPSENGVQRVIGQFKRMPEMEQTKKTVNQESYTRQRITKESEVLKKQYKENREMEITELMYQCLTGQKGLQNLIQPDLQDLGWILNQKLKEINKRCESLKKVVMTQPAPPLTDLQQTPQPQYMMPTTQTDLKLHEMQLQEQLMSKSLGLNLGMLGQPSNPGLGHGMGAVERPHQWISSDWTSNPNERMGFDHGHGHGAGEMMMAFNNNLNNPNWSGGFFSWGD